MLLVGRGPPPDPGESRTGFAQLRTAHFLEALRAGGHDVAALWIEDETDATAAIRRDPAEVIVSAGPYAPGRAACLGAGDRPVWADVPGDPFAELAAQGAVSPERRAAAFAAAAAVLGRADAISTVSERQRWAALGQLGSMGRLAGDALDRVVAIPIGFGFPLPRGAPRPREAGTPLEIALAGGFNAWFDTDTLVAALSAARERGADVRVVSTGGALPDHPPGASARLERWDGPKRLLGWVAHGELPRALAGAHLGVCLDRPGPEPALGSRTRVLLFAWLGIPVVATPCTELVAELAVSGGCIAVPPADPGALADVLVEEWTRGSDGALGERARRLLAARYDPAAIAAPLVDWARAPRRLPPSGDPGLALARDNDRLKAELAAIFATPTWKALSRLHRGVRHGAMTLRRGGGHP